MYKFFDKEEHLQIEGAFLSLKDPEDMDERFGKWNIEDLPSFFIVFS